MYYVLYADTKCHVKRVIEKVAYEIFKIDEHIPIAVSHNCNSSSRNIGVFVVLDRLAIFY